MAPVLRSGEAFSMNNAPRATRAMRTAMMTALYHP